MAHNLLWFVFHNLPTSLSTSVVRYCPMQPTSGFTDAVAEHDDKPGSPLQHKHQYLQYLATRRWIAPLYTCCSHHELWGWHHGIYRKSQYYECLNQCNYLVSSRSVTHKCPTGWRQLSSASWTCMHVRTSWFVTSFDPDALMSHLFCLRCRCLWLG